MKNVFVPLDGSELAEQAVDPALALAKRLSGRLHLATIVLEPEPVPIFSPASGLFDHSADTGENHATEYLSGLVRGLHVPEGVEVATHVRRGEVGAGLMALMDEVGADILVLTTHGRGAFARYWLGGVADQLVREAGRPAVTIRPDGEKALFQDEGYPGTVLVAVDGSPSAEEVLEPLEALLPGSPAQVILAAVAEQPLPFSSPSLPDLPSVGDLMRERQNQLSSYLEDLAKRMEERGVSSVGREVVVDNAPARALLRIAEVETPDMIALATHGRGGAARLFAGSVADKLIRAADVPVFTVPIEGE